MAPVLGGNELLNPMMIFERIGLKAGDRVADLGCGGAGHFIIPSAEVIGENSTAYAVDIIKSVLETVAAKARLQGVHNLRTVWSDIEKNGATRIEAESLDFTFLINVLFQTTAHDKMIAEAKRLLKPGGKLLVIDWGENDSTFGPPKERRVAAQVVRQLALEQDLKLLDSFQAGAYHYALLFIK